MRRTFAMLALAASVTTSVQAQRAWQSEIGIQGGFVRVKPSGTGQTDHIDVIALPGANYVLGLLTHGTLYAIIPWSNKVAIEPSLVFSQLQAVGSTNVGRVGLRANYALTPKVYGAAGGVLLYIDGAGQNTKQLGVQAAVGYRLRITGGLNGRVEANYWSTSKTDALNPFNGYGLLLGMSTRLGSGGTAASRRALARAGAWQPVIGISGGYFSSHEVGGAQDISGFTLPALGGSVTGIGGQFLGGPPTMFAIFPVGNKIAIEPGLDLVRVQQQGPTTGFSANMSGRLNYAVSGRWYAAGGVNMNYIKSTGVDGSFVTGANLAWGYRFPFTGAWTGRVELNYTMFGKNDDLGVAPQNTFGVMLGVMTPLR